MSTKRAWVWAGRLAALVAAVVVPACGSTPGSGLPGANGILWNSTATGTPPPNGTGGGQLWNNPNTPQNIPIGIQNIIVSTDDATYLHWASTGTAGIINTGVIQYIIAQKAESNHPLSTDTGSVSITSRESTLEGYINGYRQKQLGNVGGGGVNGGIAVGNITGIILAGHFIGTKMARAHCKHYALFHPGFPAQENFEGDAMLVTNLGVDNGDGNLQVPPLGDAYGLGSNPNALPPVIKNPDGASGRLGKLGVIAYKPILANDSIVYSGPLYSEPDSVFPRLIVDFPADLGAIGWTNFAVGHWRGGTNAYYWNIIFLVNPNPAN